MAETPRLETHSPAEIEQHWLDNVYRGEHVAQLTARAISMGALLGAITGLSNLYVGLKVGWNLGVVVTASVMGWALWTALRRIGLARTPMTILETNAMASTASAAGYSTGANLASAIAAYLLVVGHHLPFWQLTAWTLTVAVLGVCFAIPIKRQLVNVEQLPFPTGTAAAKTLEGLYAEGGASQEKARALFWALAVGVGLKWLTGGMAALDLPAVPEMLPTPTMAEALPWLGAALGYTFALELSSLLVAAGALIGWRVCWSLLLGAVLCFGVLAPRVVAAGIVESSGYRAIVGWSLWAGVPCMVVAAMLSLLARWRVIARALGGLTTVFGGAAERSPIDAVEVPSRWFGLGVLSAGTGCIWLQAALFDIPVWAGAVAVVLAFFLALVAARVTGETDQTPAGPLGKITQLGFGALLPGQVVPNLMTASVTAGSAASAADLLTDLKSGYLLGAHPRRQFLAQLLGAFVGALVVVPAFMYVLVPSAEVLGTDRWPAPAAQIWASVAHLLSKGISALHPAAVTAAWAGAIAAVVLFAVERAVPRLRRFVPSATALGLAFVLPAFQSLSFFIGGAVALALRRRRPDLSERYTVAVAAGLIAGESLMGVVVALLQS